MRSKSTRLFIVKLVLLACGLLTGLLVAEFSLRLIERAREREREAFTEKYLLPDPLLKYRLAPFASGHDANGFRNAAAVARAQIVALGDSQTWGINARREEAWPQSLARITGRTTYNMGVGGYGPVQYLALTDKALSLSPQIVVVGLYFGNDLYDAYQLAYTNDHYAYLRAPGAPPDLSRDTVEPRTRALWDEEKNYQQRFGRGHVGDWGLWLRGHTAVGRLVERAGLWKSDIWFEIGKRWALEHPDHGTFYEHGDPRTVFTTAYRLAALDLDDPRIAEGLRITRLVLPGIKARTDAAHVHLLVLMIPTKEAAYSAAVRSQRGQLDPVYERLVTMEERARGEVLEQCAAAGIECLDALPPLASAIARGEQVYPQSTESHPTPKGYFVLAEAVNEALAKRGW